MGWKDRIAGRGGRRVLEGVNFVIYLAAVIAIVALLNWFVNRNNKRWDLTPEQRYSLSSQSTKVLKELSKEVTIYVFDNDRGFRRHRDLLDRYAVVSPRVKIRYADPDREPNLAKQYAVRRYGTVIIAAGDRHVEAQSETEEGVTNALIRALKGQKTVCFIQGHGERDLDSSERPGYDGVKKQLQNENYQITTMKLVEKLEIPADCSLLVIAGPRGDYLPQEVEVIRTYVTGGGRLMLLLDPGVEVPELAKLLAEWNVAVGNDLVIELGIQLEGAGPGMTIVRSYGSSPIVEPLRDRMTLFPLARSFAVAKGPKTGVIAESLCETTADSFASADFSPRTGEIRYRPDKDTKGPLAVAVSGTVRGEGNTKSEGRFVTLGTSSLAANNYLNLPFAANLDLFMNMVNWLSADEDLISIRPKPPESQKLELTAQQMRRVLYLGVIGVPLFIIVAGTWVWWRRR